MNLMAKDNYLKVTYSKSKTPPTNYPFLLANYLQNNYFKNSGKLLDVGCGNGEYLNAFNFFKLDSHGVDININSISNQLLLNKVYQINLEDNYGKEDKYNLENKFDFIFSKSVIEHMRNPSNLIEFSHRCLKSNGMAIIMTPSWKHTYKKSFYCDSTHVTPFTRPSLKDIMEMAGFKNVKVSYFYQIPLLWKHPRLTYISKFISLFPIPYAPLDEVPYRVNSEFNKLIRFSNEPMLLATGVK